MIPYYRLYLGQTYMLNEFQLVFLFPRKMYIAQPKNQRQDHNNCQTLFNAANIIKLPLIFFAAVWKRSHTNGPTICKA